MLGYSDRINHALNYLAKHYRPGLAGLPTHQQLAHPANVALVLARHQADETTLVASILHHLLEAAPPPNRSHIETQLVIKFGAIATEVASDASVPQHDEAKAARPPRAIRRAILGQVAACSPRALDIRCADEIHSCGTSIAVVQRLGMEYLEPDDTGAPREIIAWHEDLLEAFDRRIDWQSPGMLSELRALAGRLRALVEHG
jgi:hypothetical protein